MDAILAIPCWDNYNPRKDLKSTPWFRLESDIVSSLKLFGLSAEQKWLWVFTLSLVAKKNGEEIELDLDYWQHFSGVDQETIIKTLQVFKKKGLITLTNESDRIRSNPIENVPNERTNVTNERNETDEESSEAKAVTAPRKKKSEKSEAEKEKARLVKTAYFDSYQKKYNRKPLSWGARENTLVYQLINQVGYENALALARYYLDYPEPFIVKNAHAFKFLLSSLESVAAWLHDSSHLIKSEQVRQVNYALAKESNTDISAKIQQQRDLEYARNHVDPFKAS